MEETTMSTVTLERAIFVLTELEAALADICEREPEAASAWSSARLAAARGNATRLITQAKLQGPPR
jgi:hypothetical protein